MTKQEILQQCTVDGLVVKLPETQLDRNLYLEVKKALELIGGKWKSGKVQGFVFPIDPSELLEQIAGGESRNLKKEYQFFATPDDLADEVVQLASITEEHTILEPSAGQGAIVNAINRRLPNHKVYCFELMDINQTFLNKIPTVELLTKEGKSDFLNDYISVDRIIANPPFTKNLDVTHVKHMYECLKPGGRLVSITSQHWKTSNNKKETEFKEWLESVDAEVIEIPKGKFKESGTMVCGFILVINKK
jgi:hypothetical protein